MQVIYMTLMGLPWGWGLEYQASVRLIPPSYGPSLAGSLDHVAFVYLGLEPQHQPSYPSSTMYRIRGLGIPTLETFVGTDLIRNMCQGSIFEATLGLTKETTISASGLTLNAT